MVRFLFTAIRRLIDLFLRKVDSYASIDRVMAYYAPFSLIGLLPFWALLVLLGYSLMYWALGTDSWYQAFRISGSALFTLGYASADTFWTTILEFSEAAFGLMLVALLIAYLPSMYSAFSKREAAVTLLEVRAGDPPSAVEMLKRFHRIHGLDRLTEMWSTWELWFGELDESHTSLAALVFFRSPVPTHSWVTAAGAVLDAASLTLSAVEIPDDPQAALCVRAGYLTLRHICDFFQIPYPPVPFFPEVPISIRREEFDLALTDLEESGIPLKADRDQAWQDFAGWRVNYDAPLLALAQLTLAPYSLWTGERQYK